MSAIQIISIALSLLSGIALFLFGMQLMGDGLKRVAGKSLEHTLYKLTSSPLKGIALGAAVTAVIQSSSATTVMVVGFVNAGMMKVAQSIGIIMGANIGTSITGWILCLSYIEGGASSIASLLSTSTISAVVAIAGILFMKLSKKEVKHNLGSIMLGFAILMTGMKMMSSAVEPLKSVPAFMNLFTMFSNPLLGMLIGIVFTAVLQSASASVGVLQALSVTGAISFATALPVTMGIGVGAACPVLLSAIGTSKNGQRTALIYLINDLFGLIFWGIVFYSVHAVVHFGFMDYTMAPISIALLNSVYRIATITVLSPFIKVIEKLVFALIKDSPEELEDEADFDLLEKRFLTYPDVAISQSHACMQGMARKSRKNVLRAMRILDEYEQRTFDKVHTKEALIDRYEEKLGAYLMEISSHQLSTPQSKQVSVFLHLIGDFERISDFAADIADSAAEKKEKGIVFSDEAMHELAIVQEAVREILRMATDCFLNYDVGIANKIEPLNDVIEDMCAELKSRHTIRLQRNECGLEQGFIFNDLLTAFLGVSAHCSSIAVVIIKMQAEDYDTHAYLRDRRKSSMSYQIDSENFLQKYNLNAPAVEVEEKE